MPGPTRPRMLVVDDDDAVRVMLLRLFGANFTIMEAATGSDAVALAAAWRFDIVVQDLKLPDTDEALVGLRLTTKLRDLLPPGVPIIIISGYDLREAREQGHVAIAKPFGSSALAEVVDGLTKEVDMAPTVTSGQPVQIPPTASEATVTKKTSPLMSIVGALIAVGGAVLPYITSTDADGGRKQLLELPWYVTVFIVSIGVLLVFGADPPKWLQNTFTVVFSRFTGGALPPPPAPPTPPANRNGQSGAVGIELLVVTTLILASAFAACAELRAREVQAEKGPPLVVQTYEADHCVVRGFVDGHVVLTMTGEKGVACSAPSVQP